MPDAVIDRMSWTRAARMALERKRTELAWQWRKAARLARRRKRVRGEAIA